jgi:hypothetical protein
MTDSAAPVPPSVIGRYLAAHDARDTDECLTTFTPTADVTDDGHKYHGPQEIGAWLSKAATSEYTFTRTLLSTAKTSPGWWLVVNRLDGNFPGDTITLRYAFELDGGRIARLTIAP